MLYKNKCGHSTVRWGIMHFSAKMWQEGCTAGFLLSVFG